jgi:mannose-6-phosphate isomerase class I
VRPAPQQISRNNRRAPLVAAPYFVVDMFEAKDPLQLASHDDSGSSSAQILVAVEGCAVIEAPGCEPVTLTKGDAVVIPASLADFSVRPQWAVEFLRAYVPGQSLREPETRM